jgi:hypothetical protein
MHPSVIALEVKTTRTFTLTRKHVFIRIDNPRTTEGLVQFWHSISSN